MGVSKTRNVKKKGKGGRPTLYSLEMVAKVCAELAKGKSLRTVCKMEGMPHIDTVFEWIHVHEEFSERYARAKEEAADALAEEIQEISDETLAVVNKGNPKAAGARAQAMRLRVDTRKWIMAKMKPKKYGDKLDMTSGGKPISGNTIRFAPMKKNGTDSK